MNIIFDDETQNVRELHLYPGRVRIGDFIQTNAGLAKVKTVQPACPYIENVNKYFTAMYVESEWHDEFPIRIEHRNRISVFRRRR